MIFTEDQQKVIDDRGRNLLVSAAAGSGKTAVLTERIIRRVCDDEDKIPIDRILIVTFTKAAATEMRRRIEGKLRERLEADPDDDNIRIQLGLLANARITTIDGFCNYLCRNHFQEIGLDPASSVGESAALTLVRDEAFDSYIEECFENGEEFFTELLKVYAPEGTMKNLQNVCFEICDFIESMPFPERWLHEVRVEAESFDFDKFMNGPVIEEIRKYEDTILADCVRKYDRALEMIDGEDALHPYREVFLSERDTFEHIITEKFADRYYSFNVSPFGKLKGVRLSSEQKLTSNKDAVTGIRNKIKERFGELGSLFHFATDEENRVVMEQSERTLAYLIDFVSGYMKVLNSLKRDKKIMDFSDVEHAALRILVKNYDSFDEPEPSDTALMYREYFKEIMTDEYQDTNSVQETLLAIISNQTEDSGNRFMVGDIKQSIYAFRLAKPEIFIEKYNTYSGSDRVNYRVDLKKNFRSRREVIDAVNCVFERIMGSDVGGIDYDDNARLYVGADYPESYDCTCELMTIVPEEKERLSAEAGRIAEASAVAARIHELHESFLVYDSENKKMRPCRYSDIVILLRGAKKKDVIFKEKLEAIGIPAYVVSRGGFFRTAEIQKLVNFLVVIDNPRQDIPMFGTLISEFGSFTEDEIAEIRMFSGKEILLVDNITLYATDALPGPVKEKCVRFVSELNMWREKSRYLKVCELIDEILTFYSYVELQAALPGGEQRAANLRYLSETALNYEKSGYTGLFNFVKYLSGIMEHDEDVGEKNMLDDNSDVVRIMTVHSSKGLEFPICFVSGLGTSFVKGVKKAEMFLSEDYGIALKSIDTERFNKSITLKTSMMKTAKKVREIGEEMRILYVAMTRAKEKLILTGANANGKRFDDISEADAKYLLSDKIGANSFLDFIIPPAKFSKDVFKFTEIPEEEAYRRLTEIMVKENVTALSLENIAPNHDWRPYVYPHSYYSNLFFKTSVSELKHKAYREEAGDGYEPYATEEITPCIPDFIKKQTSGPGGAERGSAYHRIMELLDFGDIDFENLKQFLKDRAKEWTDEGYLEPGWAELVDYGKIVSFLETPLVKRMIRANESDLLYREQPFVLLLSANEVDSEFPEEENVLIQGIIDVYFEEDGELVLLDYKTDAVSNPVELIVRYRAQLDYYSRALHELTGKNVKEVLIYSFSLGTTIKVS